MPEWLALLRHVHDTDFLKRNIIGIQVLATGQLVMQNRDFDFSIDFGKPVAFDEKFKNYEAFFYKAVQDSTIYQYKKIDLKYSQQVIATK